MNTTMMIVMMALIALLSCLVVRAVLVNGSAKMKRGGSPGRDKGFRRQWRKIYLLPVGLARLKAMLPGAPGLTHEHGMRVEFANIGEGTYHDGIRSYLPDATTSARYLLYKRGTDGDHCAITGAADDPIGVSDDSADSTTPPIAIKIFGAVKGTVRVTTDGTLADGDYCKAGATGYVTKATTGDLSFGRACIPTDSSSAAGDVIGMIPVLPAKYSF